jgi:putative sterol carrier protein
MSAAQSFFDELSRRGHEPMLGHVSGSVRFDIVDGKRVDRWRITVDAGDLAVSKSREPADCTIRVDPELFSDLASGHRNVTAAVLRGALGCEGDIDFLLAIQRLFPGPSHAPRSTSSAESL